MKIVEVSQSDALKRVKVTIWDTGNVFCILYFVLFNIINGELLPAAGEERYQTLHSSFYRAAQGIILRKNLSVNHI